MEDKKLFGVYYQGILFKIILDHVKLFQRFIFNDH